MMNARRFIEILKSRVIYMKARMMQANRNDKQVVGNLLGGLLGPTT